MAAKTTPGLNLDSLLERILLVQPEAGAEEVRRLAPAFRDQPDSAIAERIARLKRRNSREPGQIRQSKRSRNA